jgi:hypothetical protein
MKNIMKNAAFAKHNLTYPNSDELFVEYDPREEVHEAGVGSEQSRHHRTLQYATT